MSTQHTDGYCAIQDKMVLTQERAAVVARTTKCTTYKCEHCGGYHVTHPRKRKVGPGPTRQRSFTYDRHKEKRITRKYKPTTMAKRQPPYSKYQQWVDAGSPYWTGVSLANEVPGMAHMKRTLNAKESPYNVLKLDGFLAQHMSTVPAEQLKPEQLEQVVATEQKAAAQPHTRGPKKVVQLQGGAQVVIDNAISNMGPAIPKAWSDSKLALPEFHELPDVLKKARIENNERRREASMLHDQLCEGIPDKGQRRDVCAEIVQRMDMVSASYDAEREWKLNKTVPLHDEDIRAQYERLDLFALKTVIVDRLSPRVSYWRKQCKLRDGDALVEANLRLAEALHEKLIAEDLMLAKRKERDQLAAAEREKVLAKARKS